MHRFEATPLGRLIEQKFTTVCNDTTVSAAALQSHAPCQADGELQWARTGQRRGLECRGLPKVTKMHKTAAMQLKYWAATYRCRAAASHQHTRYSVKPRLKERPMQPHNRFALGRQDGRPPAGNQPPPTVQGRGRSQESLKLSAAQRPSVCSGQLTPSSLDQSWQRKEAKGLSSSLQDISSYCIARRCDFMGQEQALKPC